MVDRLDMLYVLYSELMQGEPTGTGLLNIAFVPQTCGMGCGLVGAKGFEILSDPLNYEAIIRELDAGRLEKVLLHEMAHNFDAHSVFLHYLPDHAHAWTDMFEFFASFRYSRNSSHGEAPDDLYNSPVSAVWKKYVNQENANWQHCVVEGGCADMGLSANNLWAMLYYRIEALHGIDAILDSFKFLEDYARVSLYLIHAIVLSALKTVIPYRNFFWFLVFISACILFGCLHYVFVEKKLISLSYRWLGLAKHRSEKPVLAEPLKNVDGG